MVSGPNVHGSMDKLFTDTLDRLTIVERRLATQGGGGGGTVINAGQSFMTPTAVVGGVFDPATGRTNLTPGATTWSLQGVFTPDYPAYRITYSIRTATDMSLRMRMRSVVTDVASTNYAWTLVQSSGAAPTGQGNAGTDANFVLDTLGSDYRTGEINVHNPISTVNARVEFTSQGNSATRVTHWSTGSGQLHVAANFDGFTLFSSPLLGASGDSWIIVEPIPAARQITTVGGGGSDGRAIGDVWQIGDGSTPPAGTLLCDGRAVSRTTFAALFADIGTRYGVGDGSTTFNLPNLNGKRTVITNPQASISLDNVFAAFPQNNVQPDSYEVRMAIHIPTFLNMRLRTGGVDRADNAYDFLRWSSIDAAATVSGGLNTAQNRFFLSPGNTLGWQHFNMTVQRAGTTDRTEVIWTSQQRADVSTPYSLSHGRGTYFTGAVIDGFTLFPDSGTIYGSIDVIPFGGSTVPSVIAYIPIGGSTPTPPAGGNKGTTAERNAAWPLPTNSSQQIALHNQKVQWQNTETGWTEQYYAQPGLVGANAPNLRTGTPAGWYPVAGSLLTATRVKNNGFQAIAAATNTAPTLLAPSINVGGFVSVGDAGLTVPFAGFYDCRGSCYYSGHSAMGYMQTLLLPGPTSGAPWARAVAPGASGADWNLQGSTVKPCTAGETVYLVGVTQGASNFFGDGIQTVTSITLTYLGPPLANG